MFFILGLFLGCCFGWWFFVFSLVHCKNDTFERLINLIKEKREQDKSN